MAFNLLKKKPKLLKELDDQPLKKDVLEEPAADDAFFPDPWAQQPAITPSFQEPLPPRPIQPAHYTDKDMELVLSKLDVINARLESLAKRLELIERMIHQLSAPPPARPQPVSPFDDEQESSYRRRVW